MSRSGIGRDAHVAAVDGGERAGFRIQAILQDAVDPQVAGVGKTIARVGANRMGVEAGGVALDVVRRLIVLVDGLHGHGVGTVGCAEQVMPRSVGRQVSHALRQRCFGRWRQVPSLSVDAVAQHLERFDPQRREQHFAVRRDGHWVDLIAGVDLIDQGERAIVLV
ncbi:hypothetical protein D3C73_969820 [compost metagenome]